MVLIKSSGPETLSIGKKGPTFSLPATLKPSEGVFSALIPMIQHAVQAEGYTTPTPIQEQCINVALALAVRICPRSMRDLSIPSVRTGRDLQYSGPGKEHEKTCTHTRFARERRALRFEIKCT